MNSSTSWSVASATTVPRLTRTLSRLAAWLPPLRSSRQMASENEREELERLRRQDEEQRGYIATLRENARVMQAALRAIADGDPTPETTARIALWQARAGQV